jgi:hypothetical protein
MLTRVREFGLRHASDFPADSFGGQSFAEVGAVITALAGYATAQSVGRGGVRERTVSKATARAALYEHLLAINVIARALALDTPGLETKFRLPRSGTDQALRTAGRAFAADAVPLAGACQQHEMPANFIDALHADIAALEEALSGRARHRDAPVAATASLDATVERGIKAVQRLHAMVRNKCRDDPAALAAWESASPVERRARTGAPPQPEPPLPSTPAQERRQQAAGARPHAEEGAEPDVEAAVRATIATIGT